jgi:hypothetical protein
MRRELRCRLFPGQFSSEFAVIVETFNGRSFSLFASRDEVMFHHEPTQDTPTEGWLSVQVAEQRENNVLVRLPHSTVENGQYLSFRPDQLRNAIEPVGV